MVRRVYGGLVAIATPGPPRPAGVDRGSNRRFLQTESAFPPPQVQGRVPAAEREEDATSQGRGERRGIHESQLAPAPSGRQRGHVGALSHSLLEEAWLHAAEATARPQPPLAPPPSGTPREEERPHPLESWTQAGFFFFCRTYRFLTHTNSATRRRSPSTLAPISMISM